MMFQIYIFESYIYIMYINLIYMYILCIWAYLPGLLLNRTNSGINSCPYTHTQYIRKGRPFVISCQKSTAKIARGSFHHLCLSPVSHQKSKVHLKRHCWIPCSGGGGKSHLPFTTYCVAHPTEPQNESLWWQKKNHFPTKQKQMRVNGIHFLIAN